MRDRSARRWRRAVISKNVGRIHNAFRVTPASRGEGRGIGEEDVVFLILEGVRAMLLAKGRFDYFLRGDDYSRALIGFAGNATAVAFEASKFRDLRSNGF